MIKKIDKPWGHEKIIEANSKYVVKKLFIKKGCKLSKQYHLYKQETLYLIDGRSSIELGTRESDFGVPIIVSEPIIFNKNDFITLEPNTIHRIEALEDCIFLEASTPELWDVERLEDDYNRV